MDVAASRPADAAAANRGIAGLRVALLVIALLEVPRGRFELASGPFTVVLTAFAVYAGVLLVLSLLPGAATLDARLQAALDLVFLLALAYASGGVGSPLRFAFYVMPVVAAVRLSPALTAGWSALALVGYVAVTAPHPGGRPSPDLDTIVDEGLALAWVGAAAVLLSALVRRRERELEALADARRQLARQALQAEARERRQMAEVLHDEVIQTVLVARQELAEIDRGVPGASERARHALDVVHQRLREEVAAMHPVTLTHAGLVAALEQVGADAARRGGFQLHVAADPAAAGVADELLFATGRELLVNAAKHARARHVDLTLRRDGDDVVLVVADDGAGFGAGRPAEALADGHLGLAAARERVRAVGGELTLDSRPGAGTRVTVRVPPPASIG
jgi:two-component system NarL family sensor kinase